MSSSRRFGPEQATPPPRAFGALLRYHRIQADLTQEALAERAGLSERAISDLERGVSRTPQSGTVELLAEALRLSAEERADFAEAARREKFQAPSHPPPLLTPVPMVTRPGSVPATLPATPDELEEPARLFDKETPDTTQARQFGGLESAPPQRLGTLPARRQRISLALGLLALLVIVAASGGLGYWLKLGPFAKSATASTTPAPGYVYAQPTYTGGTITFSTLGFPTSTNPWFLGSLSVQDVADALWGNPFVTSPTSTFLPDELAEVPTLANGDISKDGLTLTMRLRPDLRWSDGQPLTADDFAYWLEVYFDSASGVSGGKNEHYELGYQHIASYQVLNAQTLKLRYKQPFAFAPLFLPWAAPRHAWSRIPDQDLGKFIDPDKGIYLHPEVALYPTVTSGPFKLESDVPGQRMTLVPNPYYVSTTLHRSVLDQLIFKAYPDVDSLVAAFEAGQTDFAEGFDIGNGDLLKVAGVSGLHVGPSLTYQHLNFNLSQLALQDYQVRKAIEEAIDRCGMIQAVFQQPCANMRLDTILPPPSPDYDPIIKTYGYNLAQARQDMQIAGWDCPGGGICTRDGQMFPMLRLAARNDITTRLPEVKFIQQNLAELGIPVKVILYPPAVLFSNYKSGGILATGQYDLSIWGDYPDLNDDGNFSYFDSSQIPSASNPFGVNFGRVNDPLIEHDLAQGRVTLDLAARVEIYKALEQELAQKVYFIPLYLGPDLALVNPIIGNYQDNSLYQGNEWNIGDWFLTQ